ncbi:hypothetical protein [Paenibacillus hamazuiensis]|uniref:hypothetical protein n=1 Tax=Paenibacillus hamazuiensis TaxID=2936508 RepID=UPI00200F3973|nr:hypothetical protein [Paenibacillus hamazuiensis]
MISNRELKDEIEQLSQQNQSLTQELQQIKDLLQKQGQSRNQGQHQSQGQNQSQGSGGSQNQDSGSGGGISDVANDLKKLKDMTTQLETKMQNYISSNSSSGNSLTQEDIVNLILSMMNGMIDWTMDYVSQQSGQSGTTLQ